MGSSRNIGFLLLVLLIAGVAAAFNLYADEEAQKIVAAAPEQEAEQENDIDQARCDRAQVAYETIWDESLENPEDQSYEEKLEIALSEVYAECGVT